MIDRKRVTTMMGDKQEQKRRIAAKINKNPNHFKPTKGFFDDNLLLVLNDQTVDKMMKPSETDDIFIFGE